MVGMVIAAFLCFVLCMNFLYHAASDDCFYGLFHTIRGALYQNWIVDGYRPIVHTAAYVFCGCFGKWVFNLINTGMMAGLLVLLHRLSNDRALDFEKCVMGVALVLLVLCKGESYLWMAGSCNYLWAGVGALAFSLLRRRFESGCLNERWFWVALPLPLIIGWSQESFSLPIAFAICVSCLYRIKTLSWRHYLFYLSFGVGVVFLLFSALGRASQIQEFSIQNVVVNILKVVFAAKAVWVMGIALFCACDKANFIRRNAFELLVVCGSLGMMLVVGFTGERSIWCANLFAIVIVLREFRISQGVAYGLAAIAIAIMLACVVFGVQMSRNWNNMLQMYMASEDGTAFQDRVKTYGLGRFFHQVIYDWQEGIHTKSFAAFYEKEKLPKVYRRAMYDNFYLKDNICRKENLLPGDGEYYTTPEINTIIRPLKDGEYYDRENARVEVAYDYPQGIITRIRREIARRNPPPVSDPNKFVIVNTQHGRYLLVSKETGSDGHIRFVQILPCNGSK